VGKKAYSTLGLPAYSSLLTMTPSLMNWKTIEVGKKANELGLGGDLWGDGLQNGGVLIVEAGGKTLHTWVQDHAADHMENEQVLKVSPRKSALVAQS
jgi:hypothetical protein